MEVVGGVDEADEVEAKLERLWRLLLSARAAWLGRILKYFLRSGSAFHVGLMLAMAWTVR